MWKAWRCQPSKGRRHTSPYVCEAVLREVNQGGWCTLNTGGTIPWVGLRSFKGKGEGPRSVSIIALLAHFKCNVTKTQCLQSPHIPTAMSSLLWESVPSQTTNQINPFSYTLPFARDLVTIMRINEHRWTESSWQVPQLSSQALGMGDSWSCRGCPVNCKVLYHF